MRTETTETELIQFKGGARQDQRKCRELRKVLLRFPISDIDLTTDISPSDTVDFVGGILDATVLVAPAPCRFVLAARGLLANWRVERAPEVKRPAIARVG